MPGLFSLAIGIVSLQMVIKGKETRIILWPSYFNKHISRANGRKVGRKKGVPSPKVQDVFHAAKDAGYEVVLENEAAYPRFWYNQEGRVLISSKQKKSLVVRKVAAKLKEMQLSQLNKEKA